MCGNIEDHFKSGKGGIYLGTLPSSELSSNTVLQHRCHFTRQASDILKHWESFGGAKTKVDKDEFKRRNIALLAKYNTIHPVSPRKGMDVPFLESPCQDCSFKFNSPRGFPTDIDGCHIHVTLYLLNQIPQFYSMLKYCECDNCVQDEPNNTEIVRQHMTNLIKEIRYGKCALLDITTVCRSMGYIKDGSEKADQLDFMEFFTHILGLSTISDIYQTHSFETFLCETIKVVVREMVGFQSKTLVQCTECRHAHIITEPPSDIFNRQLDYDFVNEKTDTDETILLINASMAQHIFNGMVEAKLNKNPLNLWFCDKYKKKNSFKQQLIFINLPSYVISWSAEIVC